MTRKEMMRIIDARRSLLLAVQPHIFDQHGTGWAFTIKQGNPWHGGYHIIIRVYKVDDAMTTLYWKWGAYVEDRGVKTFFRRQWGDKVEHIFEWEPVYV